MSRRNASKSRSKARAVRRLLARTLAAGSYRDGTRVAASPTALFAGMVEGNRDELMSALDDLRGELDTARRDLDAYTDRPNPISEWFDGARARRADWPPEPLAAQQIPLTRAALEELGAAGGWLEAVESEVALARRPRVKSTP